MKYIRLLFYILFISKTIVTWVVKISEAFLFVLMNIQKMNVLHSSYRPAIRE